MRFLEWLGIVPKDQRHAIRITDPECWLVESTHSSAAFYRALETLAPPGSIVYLEGTTESEVPMFLKARQSPNSRPVALGTILPASDRYHMPATNENLIALADLIERYRIALPAIHTHLYLDQHVLLEWYDAFTDDPIYLSASIPEAEVRRFADALGARYRWAKHAV